MFAKIFFFAFALFAVAFAAPEPKPQYIVPAASAYSVHSAPLTYSPYSAYPFGGYAGLYPSVYGAFPNVVV
ncbi:hypothetical protein WA026_016489 [Henosepilachna vigintioctopunctata]|uniref:Neuropeptide-like 4 n=1 Tax=Henosepilachna vigintioctopunctata TaxID=420089 RepID=A0AAW1UMA1_9CUCU